MAKKVFKRLYELTISESISPRYEIPPSIVAPEFRQENFDTTQTAKQIIITDLDIEASIGKNNGSSVDQLDLSIFNTSDDVLEILDSEGAIVILKAGYKSLHKDSSGLPTVFSGQITSFEVSKEGNNTVTHITAGDGVQMLRNERITYEAPAGTPVKDVIKDMAERFRGISGIYLATEDLEGELFHTGYSAYGLLKTVFLELCDSRDMVYNIRNNSLIVHPKSWTRINGLNTGLLDPADVAKQSEWLIADSKSNEKRYKDIITVNPSDVLRAKRNTEKRGTKTSDGNASFGVLLEIPIQTQIDISRSIVKLENEGDEKFDDNIVGDYTIESIDINMQSRNGEWSMTLELKRKEST